MKHVHLVQFMAKLWKAFDASNREIGSGYICERGRARYFEPYRNTVYSVSGALIAPHEILEDVDNQIAILQLPK